MAANLVNILNRALAVLGCDRITSPLDDSKEARAVNSQFPLVRDAELRAHIWNFATARANLSASTTAPAYGYTYSYPLPTDCIRVVQVGQEYIGLVLADYRQSPDLQYQIEGRAILTNDIGPLQIRYIATTDNPSNFDACFAEALACRLAIAVCAVLTESATKKADAQADYKAAIREAVRANAIEKPPVGTPDDSWTIARIGG